MYAYSARKGDMRMFHSHHLLFTPIIRLFSLAISSVCKSCDTIFAGQIHNILWAIVTVLSLYFILRHLLDSSFYGVLAALSLLVSQGFWMYATQVEVYIPATGCLALVVAIMVTRQRANFTTLEVIGMSFLVALSIFYHQTNVLFCVPLGYFLLKTQGREGCKVFIKILFLAGITVLSGYVIVFLSNSKEKTLDAFIWFCLSYARLPNPDWGTFKHFSLRGVSDLFENQLLNIVNLPGRSTNTVILIFALIIVFLVGWNIGRIFKETKHKEIRSFLLIWIAIHFLFFLWWLPSERDVHNIFIPNSFTCIYNLEGFHR